MLRKADRVFFQQLHDFAYMNRPVSAIGLYDAGANFDRTAGLVHKNISLLSEEEAIAMAKELNTGARVQGIVIVRLIAEWVANIEDLGSLCFAVRHRRSESIFKRYALSESEHGTFLTEIFNKGRVHNLAEILRIPKLGKLKEKLPADIYDDVEKSYQQISRQIYGVAQLFKMQGAVGEEPVNVDDVVYVVYHTEDEGNPPKQKDHRGVWVKAYNKIKHRFLVFEDIESFKKAIDDEDIGLTFGYTAFSRKYEDVRKWYDLVMSISGCMAEIAALLIFLEDNHIEL